MISWNQENPIEEDLMCEMYETLSTILSMLVSWIITYKYKNRMCQISSQVDEHFLKIEGTYSYNNFIRFKSDTDNNYGKKILPLFEMKPETDSSFITPSLLLLSPSTFTLLLLKKVTSLPHLPPCDWVQSHACVLTCLQNF